MRYYSIKLSDQDGKPPNPKIFPAFTNAWDAGAHWTSAAKALLTGAQIVVPGALQVEFDLPILPVTSPGGGARIQVRGVGLQQVSNAASLANYNLELRGGFMKGLPLATFAAPFQGLLMKGTILECIGNYVGVEQTIDFICTPSFNSTTPNDVKLSFVWKPGTTMSSAIVTTLQNAYPKMSAPVISIDDEHLKTNRTITDTKWNIREFGDMIQDLSTSIIKNDSYGGVKISTTGSPFIVSDLTKQTKFHQLDKKEFIGQPTWINPVTISFTLMMRADIAFGDTIILPPLVATSLPGSQLGRWPQGLTFEGYFYVTGVRHIGDLRSSQAEAWVTIVEAIVNSPSPSVKPRGLARGDSIL